MKAYPPPVADASETREDDASHAEFPPLVTSEDVLTDEEAFYFAQEAAFACLRDRHARRPRRRM